MGDLRLLDLTQDMFQCHTFVLMAVSPEVLLRQTVKFCGREYPFWLSLAECNIDHTDICAQIAVCFRFSVSCKTET